MKITAVQTYKFSVATGQQVHDPVTGEPIASTEKGWLLLKLDTDAGMSGWGEGTAEWLIEPVEAQLHAWRELLLGADPLRVIALTEDLTDRAPWKGGGGVRHGRGGREHGAVRSGRQGVGRAG